jgi:hypothetical protein
LITDFAGSLTVISRIVLLRASVVNPLRVEHDLAEHLAFFHVLVRSASFVEWKGSVYHRLQTSAENVLQDLV